MAFVDDLRSDVRKILKDRWTIRDGTVVPEPEKVGLGNEGVRLDATVLYADLADSTKMVDSTTAEFAAEVYKTYLKTICKIITNNGGTITAFDGDRVMAVFIGNTKNTIASKTALQINWAVKNIINTEIKDQYPKSNLPIRHVTGIDTSNLLVARTGIRGSNDLVWVGRAANYAAKLCSLGDGGYPTYITEEAYDKLNDDSKLGGSPRVNMWEKRTWTEKGIVVYRSSWWWAL
jgi:class 3 adenylate cyclase